MAIAPRKTKGMRLELADITQLGKCLSRLRVDLSDATRIENLSLIRDLGFQDVMPRLINQILGDPALLGTIAARSYHHTNHFDKIVLVDGGKSSSYRLTLHMWNPPYTEAEVVDEQIHDHRFSFWSNVLVGCLASQNFARDATGQLFEEYQYIPEKRSLSTVGNFYIPVGEAPLLETAPSLAAASTSYHLPFYRIHRVVLPQSDITCTLVLRGPRQKNYASVFSMSRKYDPSANEMFTPDVLSHKLTTLLNEIEGGNR